MILLVVGVQRPNASEELAEDRIRSRLTALRAYVCGLTTVRCGKFTLRKKVDYCGGKELIS